MSPWFDLLHQKRNKQERKGHSFLGVTLILLILPVWPTFILYFFPSTLSPCLPTAPLAFSPFTHIFFFLLPSALPKLPPSHSPSPPHPFFPSLYSPLSPVPHPISLALGPLLKVNFIWNPVFCLKSSDLLRQRTVCLVMLASCTHIRKLSLSTGPAKYKLLMLPVDFP